MPAILALHGFTGRGSSWDRVQALLPGDFEVVTPDLPGHGARGSDSGHLPDSWQACVEQLAQLAQRMKGGQPVHLLGYSLGARLALGLLVEHPETVLSATLIGVRPGLAEGERTQRAAQDDRLADDLEAHGLEAFVDRWQELPLFAGQASLAPELTAEQRRVRLDHNPSALAWALRVLSPGRMPDYRPRLTDIDRPLGLMAGEQDVSFRELAESIATACRDRPNGSDILVEIVPRAGHNLPLEAPAAVADTLMRTIAHTTAADRSEV